MTKKQESTNKKAPPDYVFVLDADGSPLMPTKHLGKVRHMLKDGRAVIAKHEPFTIQLTYQSTGYTQPAELKVDTGYQHIGISVCSDSAEYVSEERTLLKDEKSKHDDRRTYRRQRRSRRRHRKPRFNNRKHSKQKGWIAPSLQNKIDRHGDLVDMWCKLIPVTDIYLELGVFDPAVLAATEEDREIPVGEGYQHGECYAVETLRQAVFQRDGYRCQICGKSGIEDGAKLHVHHWAFWQGRHGNRMQELAAVCSECHTPANHKEGGVLYGWQPKKLKTFEAPAFMNIARRRIYEQVTERCPNIDVHMTWGAATKLARTELNLPKSHANDAYAMGEKHPANRCATRCYQKRRRNNRVLQKFYDATYQDIRDGSKAKGQRLSSGRVCRNKDKSGENLRVFRGNKIRKGRVSIRRNRYSLRPDDEVLYQNRRHTVKGIQNKGSYVKLEGLPRPVRTDTVTCLKHINGWQPVTPTILI